MRLFRPYAVVIPAVIPHHECFIRFSEGDTSFADAAMLEYERVDLIPGIPSDICELALMNESNADDYLQTVLTIRSRYCRSTEEFSRLKGIISTSLAETTQGRPSKDIISLLYRGIPRTPAMNHDDRS